MDQMSFVGNILSLDCGDSLGTFQGVVTSVNKEKQTVSLKDTFRNGVKYEVPEVTIRAIDIKDLKILEITDGLVPPHKKENVNPPKRDSRHPSETTTGKKNGKLDSSVRKSHSKSPVRHGNPQKAGSVSAGNTPQKAEKGKQRQSAFQSPLNKRRENRSDGEHLEEEIHHNDSSIPRSKSFTSPSRSNRRANTPENNHRKKTVNGNGAQFVVGGDSTDEEVPWNDRSRRRRKSGGPNNNSKYRSSPLKIEGKRRSFHQMKNEECFSAPVESFMDDFDFGENLARFDKAAVFEEIGAMKDGPPFRKKKEQYLQPHENVLDDDEVEKEEKSYPSATKDGYYYLTENEQKVPAVSPGDRAAIFKSSEMAGFSRDSRTATVGLCCAQLVLGLIGGSQRFKVGNKHQKPTVVLLCGSHTQGAQGVSCGRHISQHHANVIVCVPGENKLNSEVSRELQLFRETDGEVILSPQNLPASPVDLIISALHRPAANLENDFSKSCIRWATQNSKACILSLDPSKHQDFNSKWSIFVGLPLHGSASLGNIYLCDPGIPNKFYKSLGQEYVVPYGSKFVIPLEDT